MPRSLPLFVCLAFLTSLTAQRSPLPQHIVKPNTGDLVKLNVYADNWFKLYINGKLIAVDSIEFMPHNIISVEVLPEYPMTIAVMARDNADAITGKEYEHSQIGDGGFILKLGNDVVSNSHWKAKCFFFGPMEGENPPVKHVPIPDNWFAIDFDDSRWEAATEFEEAVVRPPRPFHDYDFEGAKFIWTDDLDLHNTVIFRATIENPGWKARWNTGTPVRRIEDSESLQPHPSLEVKIEEKKPLRECLISLIPTFSLQGLCLCNAAYEDDNPLCGTAQALALRCSNYQTFSQTTLRSQ